MRKENESSHMRSTIISLLATAAAVSSILYSTW